MDNIVRCNECESILEKLNKLNLCSPCLTKRIWELSRKYWHASDKVHQAHMEEIDALLRRSQLEKEKSKVERQLSEARHIMQHTT